MPDCVRRQSCPTGDGLDHMRLDFNRSRRCRPGRKLRIECARNAIRALRRERRCGVEESKVTRVRHMHDAVLHLRDAPRKKLLERARRAKIEARKIALKGSKIERRHDRPFDYACARAGQFMG